MISETLQRGLLSSRATSDQLGQLGVRQLWDLPCRPSLSGREPSMGVKTPQLDLRVRPAFHHKLILGGREMQLPGAHCHPSAALSVDYGGTVL